MEDYNSMLQCRVRYLRGGIRSSGGPFLSKVYLNPQDMRNFHIQSGEYVAIIHIDTYTQEQDVKPELVLCGMAWSLESVKKNEVGISAMWEIAAQSYHGNTKSRPLTVYKLDTKVSNYMIIQRAEANQATLQLVGNSIAIVNAASEKEQAMLNRYILIMLQGVYLHTNGLINLSVHGKSRIFRVENINSSNAVKENVDTVSVNENSMVIYRVSQQTKLNIRWGIPKLGNDVSQNASVVREIKVGGGFDAVGGLKNEIHTIRQIIEQPLINPQLFRAFSVPPPKGLLMFGPPGTGKTLIARALAAELNARIYFINGPEVMSKYIGESEANVRRIFEKAANDGSASGLNSSSMQPTPALIFIDEIDAICPKRSGRVGDVEKRLVATLLTCMDGIQSKENAAQVMVLGATNRPSALDPAIRRPGRFDREVEIGIPNANDRLDILKVLLRKTPHTATNDELTRLSASAHGYVGSDLSAIVKEAGISALRRAIQDKNASSSISSSSPFVTIQDYHHTVTQAHNVDSPIFSVTIQDLKVAMQKVRPSALREISIDVPHVKWTDIGGQHMMKQELKEAVEWPLRHPEAFIRMGIRPPKGVLLYGPPGCSKTLTAKALATESEMNFIAIKGPELFSKWVGQSEKLVQTLFKKARAAAPTIIFFDEIDAIASHRGSGNSSSLVADRVLSQLLVEFDGIEPLKQVLIVAATNRPDLIDSALMRPGRLDRIVYVGPPDVQARYEILKIHFKNVPLAADVNLMDIAEETDRLSGAELASIVREAALKAVEESRTASVVEKYHVQAALKMIHPQIDEKMIDFFDNFRKQYKENGVNNKYN